MATETQEVIINVKVDATEAVKRQQDLKAAINEQKKAIDELTKEKKGAALVDAKMTDAYINAESNLKQLNKQLAANQNVLTATKKNTDDTSGAYADLSRRANEATAKAGDLGAAYGKNDERFKEAAAKANALTQELISVDGAMGRNFRKVGDYSGALKEIGGSLTKLPGAFGTMASGAMGAADSLKAMNTASPVGWVMIIVGLISSFTEKLQGNAKFAKEWAILMGGINAVFSMLSGYVIKAGMAIGEFVGGIKSFPDLLKKVGDAIKENLMNRLESFSVMGKAIVKILSGDLKAGFKELGNGVIQATVGITNGIDKMGNAVNAIGNEITKANEEGRRLVELQKSYAKAQRESITQLATLEGQANKAQQAMSKLAANASSVEEQRKAFKDFEAAQNKILAIKLDLLKKDEAISLEKLRIEQKNTGAALGATKLELEEKKALRIKAQDEYILLTTNAKLREEKMNLTILANQIKFYDDGAKANKKAQSEIANNESKTFEERKAATDKMKAIDDANYKSQLDAINDFAGKKIDINKIINTTDTEAAFELVKNSGIALGAQKELIAIINNRKTAIIETAGVTKKVAADEANEAIAKLNRELELYKLQQSEKNAGLKLTLEESKKIADDSRTAEYNNNLAVLKLKETDEAAYLESKKLLDQQFKTDTAISDAEFEANQKAFKLEADAINFQNEYEIAKLNGESMKALEAEQLEAKYQAELLAAEKTGADTTLIEAKYAALKKDLSKKEVDAKISLASGFAGNIATIFGKNTKVGKAAASAQIAIDTYKGAMAAFSSMQSIPVVGIPLGIAAAAAVAVTGAKAIKDVWAVKSGLPGDGGGGGATVSGAVPTATAPASVTGSLVARTSGQTAQEAQTTAVDTAMKANVQQPVLVVQNVTDAQTNISNVKVVNSL